MKVLRGFFALSLATAMASCSLDPGDITAVGALSNYQQTGAYVRVSRAPYPSDIAKDVRVDVWISAAAAAEYARITPDEDGSHARLPEGAVIIREVRDAASGELEKLTLMMKGAARDGDDFDGWSYAVTDAAGVVLEDDQGARLEGDLPQCRKCHEDREDDNFLFGVPESAR